MDAGSPTQFCRGCGWTIHASCQSGPKLCPSCAKPLSTPAAAATISSNRAVAKRAAEYRVAAATAGGALFALLTGTGLQAVTDAWPQGWLAIPFGIWIHGAVSLMAILTAAVFVRVRHPGVAKAALALLTILSLAFFPGAGACLSKIIGLEAPGLLRLFGLAVAAAPMVMASVGWYEFGRWKSIPGDSGGIRLRLSDSSLGGIMEGIAGVAPLALGLWALMLPQKRRKD